MGEEVVAASAISPTVQSAVDAAFQLERRIFSCAERTAETTWELAEALYLFHKSGGWGLLGYDTLNEFLAQPELGMSRRQFFSLTRMWRDLVVVRQVEVSQLKRIEPAKVQEVVPAVLRGDVDLYRALGDAEALGHRDLRARYRGRVQHAALPDSEPTHSDSGQAPSPDAPLEATLEPDLVQCPVCRTLVHPTRLADDPDRPDQP